MEDAEHLARRADQLVRLTKKATANLSHLAPNSRLADETDKALKPNAVPHGEPPSPDG